MDVKIGIKGLGVAFPEKEVTNQDLELKIDTTDEWIYGKTGIKTRYFASSKDSVSKLGFLAAKDALKNSKIDPSEIDLIIVGSNTHDYTTGPFTSTLIKESLCAKNALAIDLNIACAGFVYSLEMAQNYVNSGKYKNILIVNGEVWTKLPYFFEDRTTAVIFGDGAAAAVISPVNENGLIYTTLHTDSQGAFNLYRPNGGGKQMVTKSIIENKKDILIMNGKNIFSYAVDAFQKRVQEVCKKSGISLEEIDFIISHQANINIISKAMSLLNLPMSKTHTTLEKFGNTGGSSAIISLKDACDLGKISKGDNVLVVQFGAGLASGATIMKWAY